MLKLFSAADTSQKPILDFDRCQGNLRCHKPDWILSANHILRPGGPVLMQYPALSPRKDPAKLDPKNLSISLLVLPWPRILVDIELQASKILVANATDPDSGNVLALPVIGYVFQNWLPVIMSINMQFCSFGLCTQYNMEVESQRNNKIQKQRVMEHKIDENIL